VRGDELRRAADAARLDRSIVSSFPQTLRVSQGPSGWVIEEIGR
jgi:hypothetical protein